MNGTQEWRYLHDGGPAIDFITVENVGDANHPYAIKITFSDVTDYSRLPYILKHLFPPMAAQ